jgi:predicted outer membrane protein
VHRILAAVGALAAVLIVGLGTATVVGSPSDPRPAAPTVTHDATTDRSGRVTNDEPELPSEAQKQAVDEQLTRAVHEEAERLAANQP